MALTMMFQAKSVKIATAHCRPSYTRASPSPLYASVRASDLVGRGVRGTENESKKRAQAEKNEQKAGSRGLGKETCVVWWDVDQSKFN
jgi:hypothetical protein